MEPEQRDNRDRETGHECVMRDRSPEGQFSKSRVVMIALRISHSQVS